MIAASGVPYGALALTVALLVVNGFFVATEFSLLAARRDRIEAEADGGRWSAAVALRSMGSLGTMLAGSQLGITMASLGLGAVTEPAVASMLEDLIGRTALSDAVASTVALVLALGLVVFLHLLLAEMMPKSLALSDPERTIVAVAPLARGCVVVLRPVSWALNQLAQGTARLLGVEPADELRSARTAAEIGVMLEESRGEGLLQEDESALLAGALAFVGRRVRDVMVPVDQIDSIGIDEPVTAVEERFRTSGHSRLVVVAADGRPIAFVHVKDVLALTRADRVGPLPRAALRSTFHVTPDDELGTVLVRMRASRRHLALVVDADRSWVGLLTLEDVVESIVGDIIDETDVVEDETAVVEGEGDDGEHG